MTTFKSLAALTALTLGLTVGFTACDDDDDDVVHINDEAIERDLEHVGNDLERGAEHVGHEVQQGAHEVGQAVERGAEEVEEEAKEAHRDLHD